MHVDVIPNRGSPPAVLLRESYRNEEGKPRKRTLANLSALPIQAEAALDGIYVIRTNVPEDELGADEVVEGFEDLSEVERAFRIMKGFALEVGPVRRRLEKRVRAHVFLCILARSVRWHMEEALAPLLLTDHDPEGARPAERLPWPRPGVPRPERRKTRGRVLRGPVRSP